MRSQCKIERPGFLAYQDYLKIKLHFNSDVFIWKRDYDYNLSEKGFLKRTDLPVFERTEKMFKTRDSLIEYLISAFLFDRRLWLGDLLDSDEVKDYHIKRLKRTSALMNTFSDDCFQFSFWLQENDKTFQECFLTNTEKEPILITLADKILSLETVVILYHLEKMKKIWNPINPLSIDKKLKIEKYKYVLALNELNKCKIKSVIKELV